MSDIKLDTDNDLDITNNDLTIITGLDEVTQRLRQTLKTFQGEWFLNLEAGVSYYQDILKKNPNLDVVSTVLKNAILSVPGVIDLLEFEFDFNIALRTLSVDFTVRASEGEITLSETLP